MARPSTYSDTEKARVYVVLRANDNNLKRTARETGVPQNTIRRWRVQWETNPPKIEGEVESAVEEFKASAERVRRLALTELEAKIPTAKPSELITIVGVLDDKLSRLKGLDRDKNLHVHHHLPSPDEIRASLGTAVAAAIDSANSRQEEIVDAEIVEAKMLPSP